MVRGQVPCGGGCYIIPPNWRADGGDDEHYVYAAALSLAQPDLRSGVIPLMPPGRDSSSLATFVT